MRIKFLIGVVVPTAVTLMIGVGCGIVGAEERQVTPTTTVPVPTTAAPPATLPTISTNVPTTVALDTSMPQIYNTCEEAIAPPETANFSCDTLEEFAFTRFGGKLGLLYEGDLGVDLGGWAPQGEHDPLFNRLAIFACALIVNEFSELAWYEAASENPVPTVAEHEVMFETSLRYLCGAFGYKRQFEWESYIPFTANSGPGATTTVPSAGPTTTVPGIVTTLPPAGPSTTLQSASGGVTVIGVGSPHVPTEFTCEEILLINDFVNLDPTDNFDDSTTCGAEIVDLFNRIVAADPQAFQSFVYSPNIGVFTGSDYNVEPTAWVGFLACLSLDTGGSYESYQGLVIDVFTADDPLQQVVTIPTATDTQAAWNEASAVLCPFLGGSNETIGAT